MNASDLSKIAAELEACAAALRSHGRAALEVTRKWQTPLSSGGGPGPKNGVSDPTGNAAVKLLAGRDMPAQDHRQLTVGINAVYLAALDVHNRVLRAVPGQRALPVDEDGVPEGCCRSCWRDKGYKEPCAVGMYARYCRWCGGFLAEHKVLPSVGLLDDRHRGVRITQGAVLRSLGKKRAG